MERDTRFSLGEHLMGRLHNWTVAAYAVTAGAAGLTALIEAQANQDYSVPFILAILGGISALSKIESNSLEKENLALKSQLEKLKRR